MKSIVSCRLVAIAAFSLIDTAVHAFASNMSPIEGYNHVHPEIAEMLIGDDFAAAASDDDLSQLFDVNPNTLSMQLKEKISQQKGVDSISLADDSIMPINQLVAFANHCDDVVFQTDHLEVPKKILGLICLSQLQLSTSISKDDLDSSLDTCNDSAILVASMVAINLLESSIRAVHLKVRPSQRNNLQQIKGSPLLSNMIEDIGNLDTNPSLEYNKLIPLAYLSPILKALLLPNKVGGVNLRNLLSHGFLSTLDRRWLSLTLVLIQTLDSICTGIDTIDYTPAGIKRRDISAFTNYELMKSEITYGRILLSSASRLQELEATASLKGEFVPQSHNQLLRFTLQVLGKSCFSSNEDIHTVPPLTTIFITSISSLLEHSLRLIWCKVNNRMDDSIARPASYYVTLDGHGQRDKHEVMISAYLCDDCTRNNLVATIGGQACSMLTDLFASPLSGAPNIRAAVCHGYFDDVILQELESLADWSSIGDLPQQHVKTDTAATLEDVASALISVFELISSNVFGNARMTEYKPLFTYASMARRDVYAILNNLSSLSSRIMNDEQVSSDCISKMKIMHENAYVDILSMKIDLEKVNILAHDLLPANENSTCWSLDDYYAEHDLNIILAECNAAQTLLSEVSHATKSYLESFEAGIVGLNIRSSSTKDRRTKNSLMRFCGVSSLVLDFYCMASYVALLAVKHHSNSLQTNYNLDRRDVTNAVERTRMTLSTFDSYLASNLDRSIKSLQQYMKGKAVKKLLVNINE